MIEFIIKYWLEVLFGLIVTIAGFFIRHYYKLWKSEKETQQNKLLDSIKEELKTYNKTLVDQRETILYAEDIKLQKAIDEVKTSNENLLKAVLGVQAKQFKTDCRQLLESNQYITFEQFDDLHTEYEIYKSLGGNGPGATLFDLVQEKYSCQMMQKDQVTILAENFDLKHNNNNK